MDNKNENQIAVFGGGCFWCTEAVFGGLKGVISVMPGYAGGSTDSTSSLRASSLRASSLRASSLRASSLRTSSRQASSPQAAPTYEDVCSGKTGHAEVIKITYDPEQITYNDLLTVFFATHDPTTLNRQGNDIGTQYRSIILYANEEQKAEAEKFIGRLKKSGVSAVTELKPLENFYEAEDYHKNYYEKNSSSSYCRIVINPKLDKLKDEFNRLLRNQKDA